MDDNRGDKGGQAAALRADAAPTTMLQPSSREKSDGAVLRAAEFAALTSRAVTDNARALVDKVHELVIGAGARKRHRGPRKAFEFKRALEAFLGDLMRAAGREVPWVYRGGSQRHFTADVVSYRDFKAIRTALRSSRLIEEAAAVQFWSPFGAGRGWATRFRATPRLIRMAAECGVLVADARDHFIKELPKNPLVRRGGSTREPGRRKMPGKPMKIDYTPIVQAMEQSIVDLNTFLDRFTIGERRRSSWLRMEPRRTPV
jgi:hypothetical protein